MFVQGNDKASPLCHSLEHFPKYALLLSFLRRVFGVADDCMLPPASHREGGHCGGRRRGGQRERKTVSGGNIHVHVHGYNMHYNGSY